LMRIREKSYPGPGSVYSWRFLVTVFTLMIDHRPHYPNPKSHFVTGPTNATLCLDQAVSCRLPCCHSHTNRWLSPSLSQSPIGLPRNCASEGMCLLAPTHIFWKTGMGDSRRNP
jgi:hypothetical protein